LDSLVEDVCYAIKALLGNVSWPKTPMTIAFIDYKQQSARKLKEELS
jgi:hypothetical protein